MRHFEQAEIANRYANYRPQVQASIVETIAEELAWTKQFTTALDIACGTGHSTKPLLDYADLVLGSDISESMLQEARKTLPDIDFRLSPAETLAFEDNSIDLITVGFAYHWFDQISFLREAARALTSTDSVLIYNMRFTGNMLSNPDYTNWHKNTYQTTYPNPKRKLTPLKESLAEAHCGLSIEKVFPLSHPLSFTALSLRNYLTTQSNISVALEAGQSLSDIDAWLDTGLSPYFQEKTESFEYIGQAIILSTSANSSSVNNLS